MIDACTVRTRRGRVAAVVLALAVPFSSTSVSHAQPATGLEPMDVIAFGSCARERQSQPIWTEIVATNPDLFLFIGDNHYADFWEKDGKMVMAPVETVSRLEEAYAALGAQPGWQRILRTCPVMATWDDHDYGANDAGTEYALKRDSQRLFMDFYGFGDNAPIRRQEGIYHARVTGPEGKRVQVIMLDTRYHRDPLERASDEQRRANNAAGRRGPYVATSDSSKTLLGESQWMWLEEQLKQPAEVRVIASSIQIVADEHGFETWGNFPHERQRLYGLIASTGASGVVFVSGDRHLTEISVDRGLTPGRSVPYPMWDFTSSGMTQRPEPARDPNSFRVGPVLRETNFGVVRITWGPTPKTTMIAFEALGDRGQLLNRQSVFLSDLSGRNPRE